MGEVIVTDRTSGERLDHFDLQPGDLYVADGGYGTRANVVALQQAGAYGVLRIYAPNFPVTDHTGQPSDLVAWLRASGAAQSVRVDPIGGAPHPGADRRAPPA